MRAPLIRWLIPAWTMKALSSLRSKPRVRWSRGSEPSSPASVRGRNRSSPIGTFVVAGVCHRGFRLGKHPRP